MSKVKGRILFFQLLGFLLGCAEGTTHDGFSLSDAPVKTQLERQRITIQNNDSSEDLWEWTTWFNIDHPDGNGDYERLDAIRFYYKERVCQQPKKIEARTTNWVPAAETGEIVHSSPLKGFWCLNMEQVPGKNCSNYSVRFLCLKACNMTCAVGHVNSECDACVCENHILHGVVRLADGAPASKATVFLKEKTWKTLTVSDKNGKFQVPGLCPDGKTTLHFKKEKYATASLTLPRRLNKLQRVEVRLKRAEKPYIVQNPETKARREGQAVSFCCDAVGKPTPEQYQWYHNETLLDKKLHRYDSTLVLRDLKLDQAGDYYCKAISEAGSVKSQIAKLTILTQDEPSCNSQPESYLIRLPHDCPQASSNSFYYDVGKCAISTCAGETHKGLRCKDTVPYCCGAVKLKEKEVQCNGYTLSIKVIAECGCQKCTQTKVIVRGRASAADDGEPMRFGHIYLGKNRIGMTGYKGTFSVQVSPETERLVLTFVDRLQKFVNTTKVLPFNKKGGAVFHDIKLLRRTSPITLDSTKTNTVSLGQKQGVEPIAELEIPPNSFYRASGETYSGKVKASVTFLDPRDISTATAVQTDLNFVNDDGDIFPLRSYGMFSVDFTDESAAEVLNAGEVRVHLDASQIQMKEHLEMMKLWSLNPETGLWDEEGDFQVSKTKRGKREERTFLIGNMEIRERRLFNLDVPESRRCYVKVRAYRSERFVPSEQIEGVVVSLINMEPVAGFSSNPRAWGRFDSAVTGANGACLPAFCDEQRADAYSAYLTATLGGEELETVESSPKYNPNKIGVPQPYLNKLQYRRTDHDDSKLKKTAFSINVAKPNTNNAEENNGPIYAYENLNTCEEAPFSAAHFRFYRVEGYVYDYNTVPFNEDDPMSWTEDYLAWWPRPTEFRACYIKVKVNGPQEITVRSRNMGGTHPKTTGKLYGIRDVQTIHDMDQAGTSAACLEFKCSGMLYDQDRVDRTLIKINPQGSCRREKVNSMLQEYLVNHLPLAVNNDTNEFNMLAPLDPLGHNYGIYTVTDQDPRTAKEIALGRCFDGTSDGSSRVMKSDVGVALTFNCAEKEKGHQSIFQALQNSTGQDIASIAIQRSRNGRQQRRSFRRRSSGRRKINTS
ncbi:cartilage intermediate layer protein 1 [Protopterus annectens]|uniref:cartilage intermediate layer protein 1 n=1 Tax=Protopterus annectens TaxID=7888 RepID=UPI001CFB4441|nr:cartilage intermediate layer protein 1 [Protopterus annectens]